MDIAGLSTNLSTINVVNDVQVAVLRQSLDTLETSGDSLTKMMEASVNPELGQNIDIRIYELCKMYCMRRYFYFLHAL